MDAAALILLILFVIGAGVAAYYAVICFQAQSPSDKPPSRGDLGPLLRYEEDMNGNSEEEPVRTAQPEHRLDQPDSGKESKPDNNEDLASAKKDSELKSPLKSVTFQTTPECASKDPQRENTVILNIDDEPPQLDGAKSILPPPNGGPVGPGRNQTVAPPLEEVTASKPTTLVSVPIAAGIPLKAMSVSYEEDGLLVPGASPNCKPLVQVPENVARNMQPMNTQDPHQQFHPRGFPYHQFQNHPQTRYPQQLPYLQHPKQVHFTLTDPSNQPIHHAKPALKSMHSDPGTVKEEDAVIPAIKHKSEENIGKPSKKAKMTPGEEIGTESKPQDCKAYDFSKEYAKNYPDGRKTSAPAVGWSFNFSPENVNPSGEKPTDHNSSSDVPKSEKPPNSLVEQPREHPLLKDEIEIVDAVPIDSTVKNIIQEKSQSRAPHLETGERDEESCPSPKDTESETHSNGEPMENVEIITVEPAVTLEELHNPVSSEGTLKLSNKNGSHCYENTEYLDNESEGEEHAEEPSEESVPVANEPESSVVKVRVLLPTENPEEEEERVVSPDVTESESSDPDVTEYSFQRGSHTPEPKVADVLANEVSSFPENKIGLTNYVTISDPLEFQNSKSTKGKYTDFGDHPPTPTSDTTKTPSPNSSHNTSLDGMNTPTIHANALGTPPVTPPESKNSPPIIIRNPEELIESMESMPQFIILEPHNSRERLSSTSSNSSSTSNGSYKIDSSKEFDVPNAKSECKPETQQVTKLKQ